MRLLRPRRSPSGAPAPTRRRGAFTLIELLISMALLALILVVLLSMTTQTQKLWSNTRGKLEQFREARNAFESMSRRLRQATLNTYWDYQYPNNDTTKAPTSYRRQSELRYLSGPASLLGLPSNAYGHGVFFQAPLGRSDVAANKPLNKLLNSVGYFVELNDGKDDLPSFFTSMAPARNRFRLYEFVEPSESLTLYTKTSGQPNYTGRDWFTTPLATPSNSRPIAENIVALIVRPLYSVERKAGSTSAAVALAPDYIYDSSGALSGTADTEARQLNQLPPSVQLTMVAIDEASAARLQQSDLEAIGKQVNLLFSSGSANYDKNIGINSSAATGNSLEEYLAKQHINFRTFSGVVNIDGAKQSQDRQ